MTLSELYLSLSGRISRRTFWLKGVLPLFIIELVLGFLSGGLGAAAGREGGGLFGGLLGILVFVVSILLIWPALAISFKRWHDRGKSGWWVLIGLVPIIGSLWVLIECGFLAGTPGPNKFGPAPDTMPTAVAAAQS
ncbi:MAG: DUF805 domain-containing protein [Anaerolineae bacterium]